MRRWWYMVAVLGIGCSSGKVIPQKAPIPLEQVPANVMKVAQQKLPGVKFERAMKKDNGEFEVIGKDPRGKVREIDIRPDGTVTEIE
jgi:hypothetical protein